MHPLPSRTHPHPIHRPARCIAALNVSIFQLQLLVFLSLSLLALPGILRGQEVAKACGPKWAKKAAKLDQEQLRWMLTRVALEVSRDLDGDGELDTITLSNAPSFRDCDVRKTWSQRDTRLDIEYANGKKQRFHWIRNQRVELLKLYRETGQILVVGIDADGAPNSKWVDYGETSPAVLPALPEKPGVQIAGKVP